MIIRYFRSRRTFWRTACNGNKSKSGNLTYDKIDRIIITKNQEPPKAVKISYKTVKDYFPKGMTPQEYKTVIKQALEEWFEKYPKSRTNKTVNFDR